MRARISEQAKILIIDDEVMAADVLCRILEAEGFQHVERITDPREAVARFEQFEPDLVILDWMMPGLSGLEVLEQLRAEIPRKTHLPILVVTAMPHLETRHEALANGATDFLTKPYDPPEIVLRISNLLETRFLHLAVEEQSRLLQIRVEEGAAELTKANAALAAGLVERELVKEESVLRIAQEWEQSFDAVPDHVCILDMEGKILRANRSMRAQFEPMHGALTGIDYRLCYCGAATLEEQPGCAETASGRPTVWEGKVQGLEGWFWIATYPLTEEGVQWGTVSVACDMTWRKEAYDALQEAPAKLEAQVQERTQELGAANSELSRVNVVQKSVEEALRLSEEQLKTAVFGADLGTWDWEIASGKLICSARTEEMFGLVEGTLNNVKVFESAVHPEDRTPVRRALEEAIKTHGAYEISHRVIWPDGIVRWVAARGGVRTDAAGSSTHVTGTVHDITARKHDEAKEVLRAAERAAIALLGQGALLRTDIQTLFDQAVALVAKTLGTEYAKVLELQPGGAFLLRAGVGWKEGHIGRSTLGAGTESQAGYTLISNDPVIAEDLRTETRFNAPPLWHQHGIISAMTVIIGGPKGPFGVLGAGSRMQRTFTADDVQFLQSIANTLAAVIERTSTETTLHEAKDEAERANVAKSDFLSRMSHELRTPLNAILGFGQLLENDLRGPEDAEGVQHILKAGRHLLGLINEVLDIASIEAGRLAVSINPVDAGDILAETIALVRPLAARRKIKIVAPQLAQQILADEQRLKQVFLNLLSNAIKYNRESGRVTVTAAETPESRLRIEVSDTGAGIAPHDLEKLFIPFERLAAERTDIEGAGLGLAVSQRLVVLMGGVIGVESTVGEGSTFWIELPLAPSVAAASEPATVTASAKAMLPGQAATVLCIEDNPSNLLLIKRIFAQRPGLELLAATDGRQGLELARTHHPDLILLDVNLPDMDGHEVLVRLRSEPGSDAIPVIVISADATAGQINRLTNAGASEYITKPLDVRVLLGALDRALRTPAARILDPAKTLEAR